MNTITAAIYICLYMFLLSFPDGNQVQIVSIIFAAQWVGDRLVPDQDETLEAGFFASDALPPMVGRHERLLRRTLTAGPSGVFE